MFKKYRKIIIAVVVIVVLFLIYNFFFGPDGGDEGDLVSTSVENAEDDVTQSLLATLLEIRSVTLDESIFEDPALNLLEDFSQPVPPQAVGRPNPFLPIGIDPEVVEEPEPESSESEGLNNETNNNEN